MGVPVAEREVGLQVEREQLGEVQQAVQVGALVPVLGVHAEAEQGRRASTPDSMAEATSER